MPTQGNDTATEINLTRRTPLNSQGICSGCKKDAKSDFLRCFACDELYHVINCPSAEKQVTKTFMENNPTIRWTNIKYVCNACEHDKQLKKDILVSNRMCVMEEQIRKLSAMVTEIKNSKQVQPNVTEIINANSELKSDVNKLNDTVTSLVEKLSAQPTVPQTTTEPLPKAPSYVEVTKSVIVVKKQPDGEVADMQKIQKIAVDTGSAVTDAYQNPAGHTVVVCENDAAHVKMKPALEEALSNFTVVCPNKRKPEINIAEMTQDYTKEDLFNIIKAQNKDRAININEDNFKIILIKPHAKSNRLFMAAARVSEEIRDAIENAGNRLIINSKSCPIFDRLFVRRCNFCQSLTHWKDDCREERPICGHCANNHETKFCNEPNTKCHNCSIIGIRDNKHETSDRNCTAYINAQNKYKGTINYYSRSK